MSWKISVLGRLLLLIGFGIQLGVAQTTTATITGLIADQTGGVLPGAEVVVTQVETGVRRSFIANSSGRYIASQLSPGLYEISVTAAGFGMAVRRGITLQVGQEVNLSFDLNVGEVSEQVTVTGEVPLVDTSTSAVSGVVEEKRITELPLNGRDFTQLALVQPGIVSLRSTAANAQKGFGTRISMTGVRPDQTAWLLDGANIKSFSNFGTPGNAAGVMLGVDAVREFQVLTSNYSADFGGTSGGVISMVTKSGTNQLHGSAYEFLRNDNFDARNFFDGQKPEFRRNQFGGSVGGPIKKDKTFFFGNYEGLREETGRTSIAFVPDENAHRGLLPLANGGVEQVQVAASVRGFLDLYPLPNGSSVGGGIGRLITSNKQPVRDDYFTSRFDHHLGDGQTLFGRFTFDQSKRTSPDTIPVWQGIIEAPTRYAAVQYDRVISPTFLSTSRVAYNRTRIASGVEYLVDYPRELWLFSEERPPSVTFTGGSTLGAGANETFDTVQNLYEFGQSFLYTRGNQAWKLGFSFTKPNLNVGASTKLSGSATWSSLRNFLVDAPLEVIDLGVPGTSTQRSMRQSVYGAYFQDDWKVRPNFNLNLGVRYETFTSPSEKWGRMSTVIDWTTATSYDYGKDIRFWNPSLSRKNFSPRVGFAWDTKGDGKTAIRGGFGIFYNLMTGYFYRSASVKNTPYAGVIETPLGNLASAPADLARVGPSRLDPRWVPDTTTFEAYEWDQSPGYDMKLNLAVQQELGGNFAITVGYLGGRGFHLWQQKHANAIPPIEIGGRPFVQSGQPRPNPNGGPGLLRDADAQSFYNGLQIELKKRLSRAFQFQASYTFSKTIDDSTTGVASSDLLEGISSQPYNSKADRGLSALHIGQNLVVNGLVYLPSPARTGFSSYLFGGWQGSSIFSASAGTPMTPHTAGRNAPDGGLTAGRQHPDFVGGRSFESLVLGDPNGWFDVSAFTLPPAGFYGNAGRNIIPGPAAVTVDLSLMKNTPLGSAEGRRLEFRFDIFNLLNRANFNNPGTSGMRVWNASNRRALDGAGTITSTTTTSRQMQFALKYIF